MNRFGIRPGYVPNTENSSLDGENRSFWTDARARTSGLYQWHVYAHAAQLVRERSMKFVLDVGCGTAEKLMQHIAPLATVYGIDQPKAVEFCRNRHRYDNFFADNFESPTLALPQQFDLVICSDVIEHVTNPDVLLEYLRRFSGAETLLLLSTPDRTRLRGPAALRSPKLEHVREWSFEEFDEYLRSRGYTVHRHWHLPPVRTAFNAVFLRAFGTQLLKLRPYRYNQVVLCQRKTS